MIKSTSDKIAPYFTLREAAAIAAMQGFAASDGDWESVAKMAENAVKWGDALVAALQKDSKK